MSEVCLFSSEVMGTEIPIVYSDRPTIPMGELFHIGDEVSLLNAGTKSGERGIVISTTCDKSEIYILWSEGVVGLFDKTRNIRKTGRNYPEIVHALKRLKDDYLYK